MSDQIDIKELQTKIKDLEKELRELKKLAKDAVQKKAKEHEDLEGIEGEFDGLFLVTSSGEKYEVPVNYAAKSKLVCGDMLKMFEKDGKPFFKQLSKVDRVSVDGVISKKEGEWYFISDSGSHKILQNAAEFHAVEVNDEAIAILPRNNLHAPYATLEKVLNKEISKPKQPPKPMQPVQPAHVAVSPVIPQPKPAPAPVQPQPLKKAEEEGEKKDGIVSLRTLTDDDLR